jgi:hypothetical protein
MHVCYILNLGDSALVDWAPLYIPSWDLEAVSRVHLATVDTQDSSSIKTRAALKCDFLLQVLLSL